jgi:hypothetical protein
MRSGTIVNLVDAKDNMSPIISIIVWPIYVILFTCWIFFFLHSMQIMADPRMRTKWFLVFFLFNVLAIIFYYLKVYRSLPKADRKLMTVR